MDAISSVGTTTVPSPAVLVNATSDTPAGSPSLLSRLAHPACSKYGVSLVANWCEIRDPVFDVAIIGPLTHLWGYFWEILKILNPHSIIDSIASPGTPLCTFGR
jgi:hypothetical protein